jgi:hypothetical protein
MKLLCPSFPAKLSRINEIQLFDSSKNIIKLSLKLFEMEG